MYTARPWIRWFSMNRIVIAVLALALVAAGLFFLLRKPARAAGFCDNLPKAITVKEDEVTSLKLEDLKIGRGTEATTGKTVSVNYVGRLANGKQFDTSCERGQPFEFQLGARQVIQGWDSGLLGMKVGGWRRLVIPARLGYGPEGAGSTIPPNAVLVFDIELLDVK